MKKLLLATVISTAATAAVADTLWFTCKMESGNHAMLMFEDKYKTDGYLGVFEGTKANYEKELMKYYFSDMRGGVYEYTLDKKGYGKYKDVQLEISRETGKLLIWNTPYEGIKETNWFDRGICNLFKREKTKKKF